MQITAKVEEHEIVLPLPERKSDFRYQDEWIYPILTAPMAGKGPADVVCPDSHIEFAKEFLADCHKFLIIGSSGLDNDLLALLDSVLEPGEEFFVDFVGDGEGAGISWSNYQQMIGAFGGTYVVHRTRLFKKGFRQYVSSDAMRQFAKIKAEV